MTLEKTLSRIDRDTQTTKPMRRGLILLGEMIGLALALMLVPFVVYLDVALIGNRMSERSLTEFLQACLVAGAALCFWWGAWNRPAVRGYLILFATLLSMMYVRENDALFDQITHGFWLWPALGIFGVGAILAWRNAETIADPFLAHAETRQAAFLIVGLILLLFFSRLFGTGALWEAVMGGAYDRGVKTAVQEGLELMAYVLIAYGAVASLLSDYGRKPAR